MSEKLQLEICDICLLIPGKISKAHPLPQVPDPFCRAFNEAIDATTEAEYEGDFNGETDRFSLGEAVLCFEREGVPHRQPARMVCMVHKETGIAVLEILVHDVSVGGIRLLEHYCGGMLDLEYRGKRYSRKEFLELLHFRSYGRARSMVFTNDRVTQTEIVNALVNEEYPLGTLMGSLAARAEDNLAQYSTARVYASDATMLEVCSRDTWKDSALDRIPFQVTEIFFIELLLLLDASIDKICLDTRREESRLREGVAGASRSKLEELTFDMSQTVRFADFNRFRYPTTRESAGRLAKAFGIDGIFEKYENNRNLLKEMVQIAAEHAAKERDAVKNRFLFFITALSMISAVNGALGNLKISFLSGYTYFAAILIVGACYLIYKLITKKPKKS